MVRTVLEADCSQRIPHAKLFLKAVKRHRVRLNTSLRRWLEPPRVNSDLRIQVWLCGIFRHSCIGTSCEAAESRDGPRRAPSHITSCGTYGLFGFCTWSMIRVTSWGIRRSMSMQVVDVNAFRRKNNRGRDRRSGIERRLA